MTSIRSTRMTHAFACGLAVLTFASCTSGPARPPVSTLPARSAAPETVSSGSWELLDLAPAGGSSLGTLSGVAAIAPDDIWAVGSQGGLSKGRTLIQHWDGETWAVVESPNVGKWSNGLQAVDAVSATDVWAVGERSTTSLREGIDSVPLMMHWDGTSWAVVDAPQVPAPYVRLLDVHAVSSTEVWAVGSSGSQTATEPLIMRWDGSAWSIVEVPQPAVPIAYVGAVDGIGSDLWAVGYQGASEDGTPFILRWDGSAWKEVTPPSIDVEGGGSLSDLVVLSPSEILAVGSQGPLATGDPLVASWDGKAWTVVAAPEFADDGTSLSAVAASSATDLWVVGVAGSYPRFQPVISHWDGGRWTEQNLELPGSSKSGMLVSIATTGPGAAVSTGRADTEERFESEPVAFGIG